MVKEKAIKRKKTMKSLKNEEKEEEGNIIK